MFPHFYYISTGLRGSFFTRGYFHYAQISSCKHLSNIADHKAICLNLNIEEFKPWRRFNWKLNSSILEEKGYLKLIEDLFQDFELRRENVDKLENWKIFKNEVENVSKSYSNAKAKQRKAQIQINKEIKTYSEDWETLDRIDIIDNEISTFRSKGNLIRSRYDDLRDKERACKINISGSKG